MKFIFLLFLSFLIFNCQSKLDGIAEGTYRNEIVETSQLTEKQKQISNAAISIINPNIIYDPTYFRIDYPNGDIPEGKGVCTDVVIRTYRKLGVDLQKEVHEDMKSNFHLYPKIWGLTKPDTHIDHRRVPNLMVYFGRFGTEKPITTNPEDYEPGDIICWRLSNGMTHIGMMIEQKSDDGKRYKIVHNIGSGQIAEDILFDFEIIGHYSYENFK
jgi:uncharacterized protein YijF (DUF1287 family)